MNIAIIDAEIMNGSKHRFPNLCSMKISGYYKQQGAKVCLIDDWDKILQDCNNFDIIYISKVFTNTFIPEKVLLLHNVIYGGTGFYYDVAPALPYSIEHSFPDYNLYNDWIKDKNNTEYYLDYSIGYLTRGCFRQCEFCVNRNCKKSIKHSEINEFLDLNRKYLCFLDDNVLACKDWRNILKIIPLYNKAFQFKQGMDERLMTVEKAEMFSNWKYKGDFIFAFDNIKDYSLIESKLKIWKRYVNKTTKFYIFCGFDHQEQWDYDFWVQDVSDIFKRIELLIQYKCIPYIMRFERYKESPFRGLYVNLARWCNQPSFFKKKSFKEFCMANGKDSACYKYFISFEEKHPEIAHEYFNMKFEK